MKVRLSVFGMVTLLVVFEFKTGRSCSWSAGMLHAGSPSRKACLDL
jgi:hypothetical protein